MLFGIPQSNTPNLQILGIKWDRSSSYRFGAKNAPDVIRQATSEKLYNSFGENMKNLIEFWRYKDLGNIEPTTYDELLNNTSKKVSENYNGNAFLFLGGDHSITYATVKAIKKASNKNFGLIYFDAHPDLYYEYEGNRFSHACPVRRIVEDSLVKGENIIQIGIRAATKEQVEFADAHGIQIITASEIFQGAEIDTSFEFTYFSFDLDVLDPSYAPGVGNPEPGGLTTRELLEILKKIYTKLIAFDIVELNPTYDCNGITAFVASKIIREMLSLYAI